MCRPVTIKFVVLVKLRQSFVFTANHKEVSRVLQRRIQAHSARLQRVFVR